MKARFTAFGASETRVDILRVACFIAAFLPTLLVGLVPCVAPGVGHPMPPARAAWEQSILTTRTLGQSLDGLSIAPPSDPSTTEEPASTGLYVNLTEQTLSLINNTLLPGNASTAHADGVTTLQYDPGLHAIIPGGVYSNAFVVINASRNAMLGGFTDGTQPGGIAAVPGSGLLWVANSASNSVTEFNGSNDAVVAQIGVGVGPSALAFDARDHRLFVTDSGSYPRTPENVTVIDTLTDQVIAVLPVGTDPSAIVYLPSSNQVYVSNYASSNVTVFNASTLANLGSISVGTNPLPVFYDPVNGDLYTPSAGASDLSVVNPSTDHVITTIPVPGSYPGAITPNPSNDHLFILGGTQVTVVDATNQSVVAKVSVAAIAAYGIVYDPVRGDIYVAAGTDNDAKVLSGTNGSVLAVIPSYFTADGVAFDPESGTIYIADQGSSNISVIDPTTRTAVTTLDVAPNSFLSVGGPSNGTVFVGEACPGGLAEVNGTTGRLQACLTIPGRVAGLTYDPHNAQLLVSDGNQRIWVVDPVSGTILHTIVLGTTSFWAGPWIMAFDPVNNTLFVPNYDWANVSVINLTTDSVVASFPGRS